MQRAGFTRAAPITPSDTAPIACDFALKGIYVGSGGAVVCTVHGFDIWFHAPAGTTVPVVASHVKATGTTATQLIAVGD